MHNYKNNRKAMYPSVEDQLDMIYHELTHTGELLPAGSEDGIAPGGVWAAIIKDVKDTYPKPPVEEPTE
jgi:hypothetical protein